MPSLRELRRKVKSVRSTQQITKAMKLVAAARLNKAQERIVAARPFANKLERLLGELAYLTEADKSVSPAVPHPFFEKREFPRTDLVLITADRGLCGGFNTNLIRMALQFIREHPTREVRLWIVGKKGRDFFRRVHLPIEKEYVNIFQHLGYLQAEILGRDLMEHYLANPVGEVVVMFNEFKSRLQQKLVVKKLLPVEPFEGIQPKDDFIYEPGREVLVEALLPRHIKAQLYRILLESQAAELAARMTAMESATNNADDLIHSLTLHMNKVRQAAITKEISEIVSGAEALQN